MSRGRIVLRGEEKSYTSYIRCDVYKISHPHHAMATSGGFEMAWGF
jgi:hypothetical protein